MLSNAQGMDVAKPFVLLESFWFLFLLSQDLGQVKDESCSKVGGVVVNILMIAGDNLMNFVWGAIGLVIASGLYFVFHGDKLAKK